MVLMSQLPNVTISNFREMGGLPAAGGVVRSGALFRSAHLADATDEDLHALGGLGIRTIVDFRTTVDIQGDGGADRVPDGVTHLEIPVVDTSGKSADIRKTLMSGDLDVMFELYGEGRGHQLATQGVVQMALEPEKQAVFARFLQTVAAAEQRPVLWHCSAGKDRAGWAATLLGLALGVPDDALVEHYLQSNVYRPVEERAAYFAERGVDVQLMMPFLAVHEDYIRAGLAAVDDGWSSREQYLSEALGLDPDQLAALRADLIVDA